MKLYSKQLNSLAALKKEKQKQRLLCKKNAPENWLSLKNNTDPNSKTETQATGNLLLDTISSFTDSASLLSPLLKYAPKVITAKPAKSIGSGIWAIVKEIGGGYLKWKALELGTKGIKSIIKAQKKKKEKNNGRKH